MIISGIKFMQRLLIVLSLFFILASDLYSRKLRYMEEFYRLYYLPQYFNKYDLRRNMVWLQTALKCHFDQPIRALVPVKTEREYEKYQMLLMTHINYLMTKNSVFLGARFDKHEPRFYNKPFKEDILKSLEWARYYYQTALNYWDIVLDYKEIVEEYDDVEVDIKFVNDLMYKIEVGDVDYYRVVNRKLEQLEEKIEYYKQMQD